MTVKRNFKRRVRERQARTGESYVTARRHLLTSRPALAPEDDEADPEDGDPPARGISVVELIDVSAEARRVGLACRVLMFPSLVERFGPGRVLGRLHDLLVTTAGDPAIARLTRLALDGVVPEPRRAGMYDSDALRRFLRRALAGLGGTLDDGATLAFHLPEGDGLVPIMCTLSARDTAIELSAITTMLPHSRDPLAQLLALEHPAGARRPMLVDDMVAALAVGRGKASPLVYAVHGGRRHPVTRAPFVIGRSPACDLRIDADGVADEHAAVILLDDAVYLKDLGSLGGVVHRGKQIGHKRLDEGDVFHIGGHEIRFTFQAA